MCHAHRDRPPDPMRRRRIIPTSLDDSRQGTGPTLTALQYDVSQSICQSGYSVTPRREAARQHNQRNGGNSGRYRTCIELTWVLNLHKASRWVLLTIWLGISRIPWFILSMLSMLVVRLCVYPCDNAPPSARWRHLGLTGDQTRWPDAIFEESVPKSD